MEELKEHPFIAGLPEKDLHVSERSMIFSEHGFFSACEISATGFSLSLYMQLRSELKILALENELEKDARSLEIKICSDGRLHVGSFGQ
jgi:hypothetical protein